MTTEKQPADSSQDSCQNKEGERPFDFDRVFRILLSLGLTFAVLWLAAFLSPALIPFAIAALLAYLIAPIVRVVQRYIRNRVAAVLSVISGLLVVVSAAFVGLFYILTREGQNMLDLLAKFVKDKELLSQLKEWAPDNWVESVSVFVEKNADFQELMGEPVVHDLASRLAPLPGHILGGVGAVFGTLMISVIIMLYLIFLLIDFRWMQKNWKKIIPPNKQDMVLGFVEEFSAVMRTHFRAQFIIAAITGIMLATGFGLMGMPLGVLIGLGMGMLNMVPYLQVAGLIPASLLTGMLVLDGTYSWYVAYGLLIGITAIVQLIQDAILTPKIMGEAFGLRPVIILLAIMVWGQLLGLLGLIIALPMTCLCWAWYQRWMAGQKIMQGQ